MSHTVELLNVNTELQPGNIANNNAQMISKELSEKKKNIK